jgi:thiol-disulfide isomerase/thioredoxin
VREVIRKTLVLLLAAGLTVSLTGGCAQPETPRIPKKRAAKAKKVDPRTVVGAEVGNLMPPYTAQWLDGTPFDLAAERNGHVVFLNVWATWCGPCRAEMPVLQKMHEMYGPHDLKVIGVSVDDSGVETVKEYLATTKVRYPIAIDPDVRIANVLQTMQLPTSVLIDRSGHIVWKSTGDLKEADPGLMKALETSLAVKR